MGRYWAMRRGQTRKQTSPVVNVAMTATQAGGSATVSWGLASATGALTGKVSVFGPGPAYPLLAENLAVTISSQNSTVFGAYVNGSLYFARVLADGFPGVDSPPTAAGA
jgi:hypothetical protein